MKHAYLLTDTAYKMLYQAPFFEIMYRYDIRRNVQNENTDLSNIEIRKDVFQNLSPNLNTHYLGCVPISLAELQHTWRVKEVNN